MESAAASYVRKELHRALGPEAVILRNSYSHHRRPSAVALAWWRCNRQRGLAVPTLYQIIVWVIVGLIGGSFAGLIVKRDRKGFGTMANLGLGLVGALVGGLLFYWTGILPGLERIAVSLRDIVAAVIGSLIVLAAMWAWRKYSPE